MGFQAQNFLSFGIDRIDGPISLKKAAIDEVFHYSMAEFFWSRGGSNHGYNVGFEVRLQAQRPTSGAPGGDF